MATGTCPLTLGKWTMGLTQPSFSCATNSATLTKCLYVGKWEALY